MEQKIVDLPTTELIDQLELIAEVNKKTVYSPDKDAKQLRSDVEISLTNAKRILIIKDELHKRIKNKSI